MPSLTIGPPISLDRIDRYAAGVMLAGAIGTPSPNAPGHYDLPDGSKLDVGGSSPYHRDLFDGLNRDEIAIQIADAFRAKGLNCIVEGFVGHNWIVSFSFDGKRIPGFRESEAKHPKFHVAVFRAALGALDAAIPPRNEAREYALEQDHRRELDRMDADACGAPR